MIAVEEIVAEDRALHAVAVDAGAAAEPVVVDRVGLDEGARDDAVTALAHVAVHVDAAGVIAPHDVAADHGPVAAVADVDPVLGLGARHHVVLDQEVVAEAGEDAPASVGVARVATDDDVMIQDRADAGARDSRHREALDHHVAGAFEVDAVWRDRILRVDDRVRLCLERDRIAGRPAGRQIETRVVAGPHGHEVAGADRIGGLLQRAPGVGRRAGGGIVSVGIDVEGAERRRARVPAGERDREDGGDSEYPEYPAHSL